MEELFTMFHDVHDVPWCMEVPGSIKHLQNTRCRLEILELMLVHDTCEEICSRCGAIRIQQYCGKTYWCCASTVPAEPVFMHINPDHVFQILIFAVSVVHLFSISSTMKNWYLRTEPDSLYMSISQKPMSILVSTQSMFHSAACALNAFFPVLLWPLKGGFVIPCFLISR